MYFSRPYPEAMREIRRTFLEKTEFSFRHIEMKNAEKYLRETG